MRILQNQSQLNSITNPDKLKLIKRRLSQLDSNLPVRIIIVEPEDTLTDIEKQLGFPILTNLFDDSGYSSSDFVPSCEVLEDQVESYEILFIFSDGDEVFIP
jgi:hypothetical protein